MFPPTLEEWLPDNHPARFVRDFVANLPLESLGFGESKSTMGRPPYDPAMLLALWLYGYIERIRSSRQLERACFNQIGCIWLAGQLHPDHNTLSSFLRAHRQDFKRLFRNMVQVARQLELVGMMVHALDGTKIAALCSKQGAWHRENLQQTLKELDAAIETLLLQTEQADTQEIGTVALPVELEDAQQRKAKISEALAELDAADTNHLQSREPEARVMKGGDGRKIFSYNAQALRDSTSGLVVAAEVSTDAADNYLLVPMLDQAEETLGELAEETLADGGYQSGDEFVKLEEKQRNVLVNLESSSDWKPGPYSKEYFMYDQTADQYTCPQGQTLVFMRQKTKKRKRDGSSYSLSIYQGTACLTCPHRPDCTKSGRGLRTIERANYDEAFTRQRLKQREPNSRALLRWRGSIIERLFGDIKQNLGFRRFTVAGLAAVDAQWTQICMTINLKVFMKWWSSGRLDLTAFGQQSRKLAAVSLMQSFGVTSTKNAG
ncbi:MAG: IS1182 family transposase [bacterium]